ncbi:AMP-binding protein, partial [Gammaproteobacteria bacterium]|nr:AMP-binding protein [Gammaproteobacteria bacterium]
MNRPDTIDSLFRQLAKVLGDHNALSTPGREALSFFELYTLIEGTRSWFANHGFGAGDRIGLAVSQRPEMAAAFLATACSATAVPVNPNATLAENEALLAYLGVTALIVSEASGGICGDAAARIGITRILLTPLSDRPAGCFQLESERQCAASSRKSLTGTDVAFLMSTSGASNTPKIVPISHDLALTRAFTEAGAFELDRSDCCLNFRPLYLHSGLNAGLLVPLCVGGCVVLPPDFDARAFPDILLEQRVTWFLGNPAYNQAILERFAGNNQTNPSPNLRFIRSSSYSLPPDQMAALENLFGVPVLERYGGTEAGIIARNPPPPEERRPGTVGRAVDSELAVVDDQGRPLPPGVTGEVVVRGQCVINSYEGDSPASDEAFFGDWYRTGDLGSCDSDGFLRILGRQQDFINRGGLKVSVHEVEGALLEHSAVVDAACFAVPHPTLGEEVWAAVVFDAQDLADEADILAFAGRFLAESKVPRRLIVVDELPRTATGKLRRFEMTAMYDSKPGRLTCGAPRENCFTSPLQSALATVWHDVLNIDGLGPDDDFFMLGGDSLSAVRLLVAVEDVFGVQLPIGVVFDLGRTIAGMTSAIEGVRAGVRVGDVSSEVELAGAELLHDGPIPRHDEADCPLTFSQQRLWFLSQLETAAGVYNMQGAISLRGQLDIDILRRVLDAIVHRHESLRAYFPIVNGTPVQRFISSLILPMPVTDLSDLDEDYQAREVQRIAVDEAAKPYNLVDGPLIRCRLLRLAERTHVLLLPK